MSSNHLNTNKQFMIGNGILAFAVIFVVVIFIYVSLKSNSKDESERTYVEVYQIELTEGFAGTSFSVYINDSLLLNQDIRQDSILLQVERFAEQNALLIVNNETDKVATFDLSERGGKISLRKDGDVILLVGR